MAETPDNGYQQILLAVDFHDDCQHVTNRALRLAAAFDASLSLLHVVENLPVEPGNELMIPPSVQVESDLLEKAESRLRRLQERLKLPAERCHVRVGQTKRETLDVADEQEIDLIVVGSHGRHGLALLLGSTANAILRGATCDVLAVRI